MNGFAVNAAGGFRAVSDSSGVGEGETFSLEVPAVYVTPLADVERAWRDAEVVRVSWLRDRHRDQIDAGISTTLTAEQFGGLLVYIQSLRDWPQSADFPDMTKRPAPPDWLAGQTE
ncbi:phage tail assembly chaperone (plasmid) [Pseudomonas corrugata]|uniref:phage tail assembly chaperone n=1 Tax=Pseudomonas corrugata TaxID=47879 RepID=UPI00222EC692|nr:phage tail assembly chaperone [Pseudomonas corrugata]UZD98481.1 phage tail assembly chaperone [Pseudomonas corrugata]UZD98514.1 phage tail assembly chaperone [Pseudomonas corrugata]